MTLECRDAIKLINAVCNGDVAKQAELAQHLKDCPACRRRYEAVAAVSASLASLPRETPSAAFVARVMYGVRLRQAAFARRRRRNLVAGAAAVAAAVITVLTQRVLLEPALKASTTDFNKAVVVTVSHLATLAKVSTTPLTALGKIAEGLWATLSSWVGEGIWGAVPWYLGAAVILIVLTLRSVARRLTTVPSWV